MKAQSTSTGQDTRAWPTGESGPIAYAEGETWMATSSGPLARVLGIAGVIGIDGDKKIAGENLDACIQGWSDGSVVGHSGATYPDGLR